MCDAGRHNIVEIRINVGLFGPLQGRRLVSRERVLNVSESERFVIDGQHLIRATFGGVADGRGLVVRPIKQLGLPGSEVALERRILGG